MTSVEPVSHTGFVYGDMPTVTPINSNPRNKRKQQETVTQTGVLGEDPYTLDVSPSGQSGEEFRQELARRQYEPQYFGQAESKKP